MQVAIDSLTGIWMPTAGRVASVEFDGDRAAALAEGFYYSASAAAGLQTAGGGLAPGDGFVVSGADPAVPALAALQPPGVPAGALPLPESLAAWVQEHQEGAGGRRARRTGAAAARARVSQPRALDGRDASPVGAGRCPGTPSSRAPPGIRWRASMRCSRACWLGSPIPRPLASADFVAAIGDDEQFSVAVALIAQDLGFPSRVVVGVRLSSPDATLPTCADGTCRAQDLAAWTEVQNANGVWVPIDATPQFENPPSLDVSRQRDPENVTDVLPETVHEVLPPQPVQQDSAPDEGPPDDESADLGLAVADAADRRHRPAAGRARLRAVPRRHRGEGRAAAWPAWRAPSGGSDRGRMG